MWELSKFMYVKCLIYLMYVEKYMAYNKQPAEFKIHTYTGNSNVKILYK